MIKAIIVDDEPSAGEVLHTLIASYTQQIEVCEECLTIPQAIAALHTHKPDIIFLDIELADGSGFEVLEHLNHQKPRVIFVTAYEHYALKAIKHNAFDYILKPIHPEELNKVLQKITDQGQKSPQPAIPDATALLQQLIGGINKKIAVPNRTGLEYYYIDDIVLIEGQGSYAEMVLTNGNNVLVSKKVKDFEETLTHKGFLRVHKSFLINMAHIESLHKDDGGYIQMSNGRQVTISSKDREEILRSIKQASNII